MKRYRIPYLLLALFTLLVITSCDMINDFIASRTREISVITIYNSNKEKTNKLQPNDTLFVEVKGLNPGNYYSVEAVDPMGNTITMLTAEADELGVIAPQPLWYDIGFKTDKVTGLPVLPQDSELGLKAFNVRVRDAGTVSKAVTEEPTDFKLPFFVIFKTDIDRPQPIVMAGKMENSEFVLENSFEAGNELYVKVANWKDPTPFDGTVKVHIVAYKGTAYKDGDSIPYIILTKECTPAQLKEGVKIDGTDFTPDHHSWSTIPSWAQGKAFSVIVDVDNNNYFNIYKEGAPDYYLDGIDGNMVPGFVVKSPPEAKVLPANIASGGRYSWNYATWEYDYDYRDEFNITGNDTQYAWDWQFGGQGVKATWNPYINYGYNNSRANQPSLYYGTYVDVYIIDATASYPANGDIIPSSNWVLPNGLTHLTLPVQYSCYNGCGQQTIWRSDGDNDEANGGLKKGDYDVVVDIGRDGKYNDGDIVDNQPRNPDASFTRRSKGGFSIVDPYAVN